MWWLIIVLIILCFCVGLKRGGRVGIVSMVRKPKSFDEWLNYHKRLGVDKFYIRLEDTPELHDRLQGDPAITLEIGSSEDMAHNGDKSYDSIYERQRDLIRRAIKWGKREGITWLAHIDCDELIECRGNIKEAIENEIGEQKGVYNIVLDNYEAQYEKINEIGESCFKYKKLLKCNNPNSGCVSYANGKSIGRISDELMENGPHRFGYSGMHGIEITGRQMRLLHFESCDFNQYVQKYMHLAQKETKTYPFKFYNDSLKVARSDACKNNQSECMKQFEEVYSQYKIAR